MRKSSFDAVADAQTRVLILGSLPGDKSLEARQYYAHPTNQFWRLIGGVIEQDLSGRDYFERLNILLQAKIGLWDVVASARRRGSLDSDIRDVQVNGLQDLHIILPDLRAIAFNGQASAKIGRKQIPGSSEYTVIDLPSSSAGYCAVTLDWKQNHWDELKYFLRD